MIPNSSIEGAWFLYPLDLIVTILSLCGSLTMFYLCLRIRSPLVLSLKFILAISIADFFYSISNVLSNFESPSTRNLCKVEAIVRQCSFILSIFFSTCVAIASYKGSESHTKFNRSSFFCKAIMLGPLLCFSASVFG